MVFWVTKADLSVSIVALKGMLEVREPAL